MQTTTISSLRWVLLSREKKHQLIEHIKQVSIQEQLAFSELFKSLTTENIVTEINRVVAGSISGNRPLQVLEEGFEVFIPCVVLACEYNRLDGASKKEMLPVGRSQYLSSIHSLVFFLCHAHLLISNPLLHHKVAVRD